MQLDFDNTTGPPSGQFANAAGIFPAGSRARNLLFWDTVEPDHPPFEILEHPADVGFMAYGATLGELFANAALAMISLGWDLETAGETIERKIRAEGEDTESLLYDWLSAILALADSERLILKRFQVNDIDRGVARGTAWGEPYDSSRHSARTYIKAVTLHQFQVRRSDDGWTARVFLDV